MRNRANIFIQLRERLNGFGSTPRTEEIINRAIEANEWFTYDDIVNAVQAIRCGMLSESHIREWLAHYPATKTPKRVAVIMAGNIPLVGFFDLMCVIASGHDCYVKTSSKDAVLMQFIIDELKLICSNIPIYEYSSEQTYDMAIATGGDEANEYFREHFRGTRTLLRGSRHSIAVLDGSESEEILYSLGLDISSYSGMGCRSVSMLFVPRGYRPRIPFNRAVNSKLKRNIASMRALLTMQHRDIIDCQGFLLAPGNEFPSSLAMVTLYEYDNISEVEAWIESHTNSIQCVVAHDNMTTIKPPFGRIIPFGAAQIPNLWDYADGVDTMKFLLDEGV